MSTYSIIIQLFLLSYVIDNIEGCSCIVPHLQNIYCSADFVMKVRLRGEGEYQYMKTLNDNGEESRHPIGLTYNVKIQKIYKLNENDAGLTFNSSAAVLHSPPNDGVCKVDLEIRTKYLVTGRITDGHLWINLCTWGTPWAWVTKSQKKYLKFNYAENCECQVVQSGTNDDSKCYWNYHSYDGECYERHSACIIDKNSTTGRCKWQRSKRFKQCRAEKKNVMHSILP